MVLLSIELRTTSYLSWSAHPSSFRSVSVSVSVVFNVYRTFVFLALINIVNFYLDKPNVVSQLGASASDATGPAVEAHIYEALRKHRRSSFHHVISADIHFSECRVGIDPPFRGVYRMLLSLFPCFCLTPTPSLQVNPWPNRKWATSHCQRANVYSSTLPMPTVA
jgi:hypothetical protein